MKRRDFVKQIGTAGAGVFAAVDRTVAGSQNKDGLLLEEAEAFDDPGGWTLDAQFLDQMGSTYLLAHGLGVPVADATTTVRFPSAGNYRVFVRTMNWVPGQRPGAFHLLVDGQPLPQEFGVKGDRTWRWQSGGVVPVNKTTLKLGLRDLQSFGGRCDAILFAKDTGAAYHPPDSRGVEKLSRGATGRW